MKIALIGYGKMGKEIEAIALKRGHEVILKIDKDNQDEMNIVNLKKADVAIEFSTPHTVVENIYKCFNAHLPVVVGATGWYDKFDEIIAHCEGNRGSLFHATNFSVGVNLFFKLNSYLAELMNKYEDYDISMEEIHHIHKLDKPSGTAISLANQILNKVKRKEKWSIDEKAPDTLHIVDKREGEVPGTHIVKYHSSIDDIEIMHKAHSRKGFALGAVIAAEFLQGKTGVYSMNDLI
ncbi:MAG TPA: 4-hydroxy-tetrahydrodipicolinate reductase [Bacteroidia bacterium]|nr:4-hydroxy-tetrahydrodipicolinate reductase [Bacteroidia bacterium]